MLRLGPRIHRAFLQRQRAVGNHQIHVVIDGVAESLAAFAGALRIVEAEQTRLGIDKLLAAAFAGELLAEADAFAALRGLENSLRRLRDNRSPPCPPGAGACRGEIASRSTSANTGFEKSSIQQRFGRRELDTLTHVPAFGLIQAIEPSLAQVEEAVAQCLGGLSPAATETARTSASLPAARASSRPPDPRNRAARGCRSWGNRYARRAPTAAAGNRKARWKWQRSNADCAWCSSGGWPPAARYRRFHRRPAAPCAPETAARRPKAIRRSGAALRRKSYRRPETICPSRRRP